MPNLNENLFKNIIEYIQGDLRKLDSIHKIYKTQEEILKNNLVLKIFEKKNYNENTKDITNLLLNNDYKINEHNLIMNETDRTSIGLLFHENVIDYLNMVPKIEKEKVINIYLEILNNIIFSDYIDRITFQKQIWIFNEMSSLIKTMYNNHIFTNIRENQTIDNNKEIRFTKVLTKYSTEYNNIIFIQNLCNKLSLDKNDLFTYFLDLKKKYKIDEITNLFQNENYDISKLDIARLYRYLNIYYSIEE